MKITINEVTLNLKKIGQGAFSRIYLEQDTNEVYAFVLTDKKEIDYSKEAVSLWTNETKHVPQIECVDTEIYLNRVGYCNVYKMPLYKKCPNGNKIVNRLIKIYKEISSSNKYYQLALKDWYSASQLLIEVIINDEILPQSIKDAIVDIYDSTTNYDMYALEFCKRNIMQDENGEIILLDIVFNPKALR